MRYAWCLGNTSIWAVSCLIYYMKMQIRNHSFVLLIYFHFNLFRVRAQCTRCHRTNKSKRININFTSISFWPECGLQPIEWIFRPRSCFARRENWKNYIECKHTSFICLKDVRFNFLRRILSNYTRMAPLTHSNKAIYKFSKNVTQISAVYFWSTKAMMQQCDDLAFVSMSIRSVWLLHN